MTGKRESAAELASFPPFPLPASRPLRHQDPSDQHIDKNCLHLVQDHASGFKPAPCKPFPNGSHSPLLGLIMASAAPKSDEVIKINAPIRDNVIYIIINVTLSFRD